MNDPLPPLLLLRPSRCIVKNTLSCSNQQPHQRHKAVCVLPCFSVTSESVCIACPTAGSSLNYIIKLELKHLQAEPFGPIVRTAFKTLQICIPAACQHDHGWHHDNLHHHRKICLAASTLKPALPAHAARCECCCCGGGGEATPAGGTAAATRVWWIAENFRCSLSTCARSTSSSPLCFVSALRACGHARMSVRVYDWLMQRLRRSESNCVWTHGHSAGLSRASVQGLRPHSTLMSGLRHQPQTILH